MKEENAHTPFNAEEAVLAILPKAGRLEAGLLALAYNNEKKISSLKKTVEDIRRDILLPEGIDGDYIIAKILLNDISLKAGQARVEILLSARAVSELCSKLALDQKYYKLLLNAYGSLSSGTNFIKRWGELSASFEGEVDFNSKEASKIVDSMLAEAEKLDARSAEVIEENTNYLKSLAKGKKISSRSLNALSDFYSRPCGKPLKPAFEETLGKIYKANGDFSQAYEFAARVLLLKMTAEEAAGAANLAKEIKYNILPDDLQLLAFKYLKFKTPKEIAETLDAVLKRLPYADYPEENLFLAFKVMTDPSSETLVQAERSASYNRGKKLFLRSVSGNKCFSGYEDQITAAFYGKTDKDGVEERFVSILRNLPHNKDIYENADIGVKVLLGKLPEADAENQALFRKENKALYSAGSLESEAVERYLGTKDRREVLAFLRERLADYNFWKSDESKYGYALSLLVGELNGNITAFAASLGLDMLQKGWPEQSADMTIKALPVNSNFTKQSIISAYDKFYKVSNSHEDAAKRVANMLQ